MVSIEFGRFDARDDAQRAATHATVFDVDVEDALEPLHPGAWARGETREARGWMGGPGWGRYGGGCLQFGANTPWSHLAVGITRACIRSGTRARCYDVVELVNHLEAEARDGRQGRTAELLCRRDLVVLDELGYLPFAHNGRTVAVPSDEPAV